MAQKLTLLGKTMLYSSVIAKGHYSKHRKELLLLFSDEAEYIQRAVFYGHLF